jgi:arylsulfatase A-like enzyme
MMRAACLCAAAAVALGAQSVPAEPLPGAVVLVTIDTLRADHLGCYGYARPTSPFLDQLASRGLLFENAVSSVAHTAPAHASIFTGLYPLQHGVLRNGEGFSRADPETGDAPYRTLAELAENAGYETAGFPAVGFLHPITRGFSKVTAGAGAAAYTPANEVVDAALVWISQRRPGSRFLLWVHFFDPHLPDRAPADVRALFGFESPRARAAFGRATRERRQIPNDAYRSDLFLAEAHSRYDAEIRFVDRELERLFGAMDASGLNEDALWVVTADHGEGLGSHGELGHGINVHAELIRVPLVLYERGRWAGTRVSRLVRHVDLLPTLAERLGIGLEQPGYTLPGRSLLPGASDPGAAEEEVAFLQRRPADDGVRAHWERGEVYGLQSLDWKYVVHSGGRDELFDLRADPLELHNLIGESPLAERLGRLARQTYDSLLLEGRRASPSPLDEKALPELRALGYVQ